MSYIVFLSTKGLQMVQGNVSKNNIHISSYKEFEFVEGTMLDGNILDDQPIKDVLLDLKKENVDSVRLVVDSGQILVKCSVLPEVSHKQMLQFVKDEFIDVESQYTDLLYDYAVIKDKVEGKEGQLVLCAAMLFCGCSSSDNSEEERFSLSKQRQQQYKETIDKITAILKEQNYVPHMGSVMLSGHGSRIIGMVLGFNQMHGMQSLRDSFVGELVGTIQSEAERKGYYVMLIGGENIQNVVDIASRWNVEGLIILGYNDEKY